MRWIKPDCAHLNLQTVTPLLKIFSDEHMTESLAPSSPAARASSMLLASRSLAPQPGACGADLGSLRTTL